MYRKEAIQKLERWLELDSIDLKKPKYWEEGKGLTKEGWKKYREIEKEKEQILKDVGLNGLLFIDESEYPYFGVIKDIVKLLKRIK